MVKHEGQFKKGNKAAAKLTTDELKKKAYKSYCDHIASGRSKRGWFFEEGDFTLTCVTMDSYIKKEPNVFDASQKEIAESKSFAAWEQRGIDMVDGVKKSEAAIYQIMMRNKFGWDRDTQEKHGRDPQIEDLIDELRSTSSNAV